MKIAIVINTSWNIYNFRMGLVRALQKNGWQVMAIAPPDKFSDHLIAGGCQYFPLAMDNSGSNPLNDIQLLWRFYRLYRSLRPDVILHYTIKPNIYGTLAAARLGIPVINNVSGLGTVFLKKSVGSWFGRSLYRVSFRYANRIFFQNPDDHKLFIDQKLIKHPRGAVIPGSGINLQKFTPDPAKNGGPFTFLLMARLLIEKGINEYVAAIKILQEEQIQARFLLIGAPEYDHSRGIKKATLENWVNQGILEYLGAVEDVRPVINQADCVLLPSYREGLPKSLLEGACMEKPLIATDVPGCREVVKNEDNGFLCQVKDAMDLAAKMKRMYQLKPQERLAMGRKGRQWVSQKYDEKGVIKKYIDTIKDLTA